MNKYDCYIDPQTGALPPKIISSWVLAEGITCNKSYAYTLLQFVRKKRDAWLKDGKCLSLGYDSQGIQSLAHEMYEELLGKIFLSSRESLSPEEVLLGLARILISVRVKDEKPKGQKQKLKSKASPLSKPKKKYPPQTLASDVTPSIKNPIIGNQIAEVSDFAIQDYCDKFINSIAPELTQNMSHEKFRQDLMESIGPGARWRVWPECVITRFLLCNDIYHKPPKAALNHLIQILKDVANLKDQECLTLDEEKLLREKTRTKIYNTGLKLRTHSLIRLTDPKDLKSDYVKLDAFEKKWQVQRSKWENRSPWIAGLETLPNNEPERDSASKRSARSVKKRGVKSSEKGMPAKRPKVESFRSRISRPKYLLSDPDFSPSEDSLDETSETESEAMFSDYDREDSLLQSHIIRLKVPSGFLERILSTQTEVTEHISSSPGAQQAEVLADPVTSRAKSPATPPAVFHTHGTDRFSKIYLAVSNVHTSDSAATRSETPDAREPIVISSDYSDLEEEDGYDFEEESDLPTPTPAQIALPSLVIKTSCGNNRWTQGTAYSASILYRSISEFFDWIEDQYQTTSSHLDFVLDLEPRQYLKELVRSQDERFEVLKSCITQNIDEFVANGNDEMFRIIMRLHEKADVIE